MLYSKSMVTGKMNMYPIQNNPYICAHFDTIINAHMTRCFGCKGTHLPPFIYCV